MELSEPLYKLFHEYFNNGNIKIPGYTSDGVSVKKVRKFIGETEVLVNDIPIENDRQILDAGDVVEIPEIGLIWTIPSQNDDAENEDIDSEAHMSPSSTSKNVINVGDLKRNEKLSYLVLYLEKNSDQYDDLDMSKHDIEAFLLNEVNQKQMDKALNLEKRDLRYLHKFFGNRNCNFDKEIQVLFLIFLFRS